MYYGTAEASVLVSVAVTAAKSKQQTFREWLWLWLWLWLLWLLLLLLLLYKLVVISRLTCASSIKQKTASCGYLLGGNVSLRPASVSSVKALMTLLP